MNLAAQSEGSFESWHTINCTCDRSGLMQRVYQKVVPTTQRQTCNRGRRWLINCRAPYNSHQVYQSILGSFIDSQEFCNSVKQINLDIRRTFPDQQYFITGNGQQALRRVLMAYCKYDPTLGYVQGMNFIAASLLWHATQADAFWLFVHLMEDFEVRDIFLPMLPGLSKHCQIIQLLTFESLPEVYLQLAENRVTSEMFAAEWCVTLFGSVIPVNEMFNFLDLFFESGWLFFYRFVIALLSFSTEMLLKARDPIEILSLLKISRTTQKEWQEFLGSLASSRSRVTWSDLIARAEVVEVDESYIAYLHKNFNLDTRQFSIKRSSEI